MKHACDLPPYCDNPSISQFTPPGMVWECPESYCKKRYRLNPIVRRWYRVTTP